MIVREKRTKMSQTLKLKIMEKLNIDLGMSINYQGNNYQINETQMEAINLADEINKKIIELKENFIKEATEMYKEIEPTEEENDDFIDMQDAMDNQILEYHFSKTKDNKTILKINPAWNWREEMQVEDWPKYYK